MTQNRPVFEFKSVDRGAAELVPQFWLSELNDVQERVYLLLLDMWTFKNGALRVYPSIVAGTNQGSEIELKFSQKGQQTSFETIRILLTDRQK